MYDALFKLETLLLEICQHTRTNPLAISPSDRQTLIGIAARISKKANKARAADAFEAAEAQHALASDGVRHI